MDAPELRPGSCRTTGRMIPRWQSPARTSRNTSLFSCIGYSHLGYVESIEFFRPVKTTIIALFLKRVVNIPLKRTYGATVPKLKWDIISLVIDAGGQSLSTGDIMGYPFMSESPIF
jgi:hypothetical protein